MNETRVVYKKSPLSFYGTYVTLFFIAFTYFVFSRESPSLLRFFMIIIVLAITYQFAIQQYYFILTEKILIVKNHWFFWINKKFEFESIERIYFQEERESVSQKGVSMEAGILFFSKGKRYIYLAGALNKDEIRKLVDDIQSRTHKKKLKKH
jgi:hypothetical protein